MKSANLHLVVIADYTLSPCYSERRPVVSVASRLWVDDDDDGTLKMIFVFFSWTEDELSSLSWNFLQCNDLPDVIGEMVKMFKDDGIIKTRESVVKELYNQFIINKEQFDKLSKKESEKASKTIVQEIKETRENEIGKLCEQLLQDGKSKFLDWVQNVLLECCSAKVYLEKKTSETLCYSTFPENGQPFENFLQKPKDLPVISPVSYHSLRKCQHIITY